MMMNYKELGKRIREARERREMTQKKLALKINVTSQHVSNMETGNAKVSLSTLVLIANALKVSTDDLLCDTVLMTKPVFQKRVKEMLDDCNEYETRFLVENMKSTKVTMRTLKLFENAMNEFDKNGML